MNSLEQNLLNLADSIAQATGQAVAANNPAYASLVSLGTGLLDEINKAVNPAAVPAASQISAAASAIAAGVTPVVAAVKTIPAGSATATEKASALGELIGTIETIGGDILQIFHKTPTAAAPTATVTPA